MNLSVATVSDSVHDFAKARWQGRRALWADPFLPAAVKRIKYCGRHARQGEDFIGIRVSDQGNGALAAGFSGVQTCGSVWICPVCSAKILAERQADLSQGIGNWAAQGGSVAMFTFTMRHTKRDRLADLWNGLSTAWNAVTSGGEHQVEKDTHGVEVPYVVRQGKKAGQTVMRARLPHVRLVEITDGDHGWHVHTHVLVFLPESADFTTAQSLYDSMWQRWNRGLEKVGITRNLQVNQVRWLPGYQAGLIVKDIAGYFTKNTYADKLAAEMSRSDHKSAKSVGGLTAFEMLRNIVTGDLEDPEATARRFYEFCEASKGRRQMTWGMQTREILGLNVEERTDEEIAAEELGTFEDEILCLSKKEWGNLVWVQGAVPTIQLLVRTSSHLVEAIDRVHTYITSLGFKVLPGRSEAQLPKDVEVWLHEKHIPDLIAAQSA